jgi:hypothetical protein
MWTMANGAIAQQTFEADAAYILSQHSNILAHFTFDPSRDISKGTRTERAAMMAWEGT